MVGFIDIEPNTFSLLARSKIHRGLPSLTMSAERRAPRVLGFTAKLSGPDSNPASKHSFRPSLLQFTMWATQPLPISK